MCRDVISRAHSALVGAAIRLGECMGLHRDPTEYNHPPVETHVRRLIWYQLCFLDLRTAEVQGPRAFIRREDFSTRFPLNLDDAALAAGDSDAQTWTDMTFARIRFECQEMIRVVFIDQIRLEKKSISVTHALGKVESFRRAMYAKYGPLFSGPQQTPIQRAAAVMMSLLINRLYILLLHRYHLGVTVRIPDRLLQVILNRGTQHLEDAIELETRPDLQRWEWYSRAYHNYHTALLLLLEVYQHPMRREADRIWRCLDYVYETPSDPFHQGITRQELLQHRERKARMILSRLRDRISVYRVMRKMKYTPVMAASNLADLYPGGDRIRVEEAAAPISAASDAAGDISPGESPPMTFSTLLPSHDVQARVRQNRARNTRSVTEQVPHLLAYQPLSASVDYSAAQATFPPPDSLNRDVRGRSTESEATHSSDSGHGLWFMPGVADASAGTATARRSYPLALSSPPTTDDLPMLDIDWVCWSFFVFVITIFTSAL
jgi:hypothetical protein